MTDLETNTAAAAASGTWTLGDLTVRRIGFGAMRLPQTGTALVPGARPRDRNEAIGVLRRAVELGVNHIDTAAFYFSPLRSANEAERFGVLAELREAGLIRHLGLSNVTPEHLAEAREIAPVVCVQNMYGIGVRPDQDAFVRHCGEQGVAFVPFYALAADGRQAGATGREHEEVRAVARARGVTPAQVRIAWTLHRGPHVLAIPGTGDPAHLEANVAAGALRLTDGELARLEAVHRGRG
ncbi:aldo/keto reductase [Streptomyces sp. NRRL S-87]|uniref:aldo/keto reductase n=1 Tax=Streptomyces sp. NRRL S-87 TaxID=1463920 RepID=UPI0004C05C11|nr:aldo/keto reductase [Streptomyces sp. NRRL S-87]